MIGKHLLPKIDFLNLSDKQKSLLITLLMSGTVVLSLFIFHIKKQTEKITESYYLLEPEAPKTPEELEAQMIAEAQSEEQKSSETNKAFNESEDYKKFSQAYQPIAPPEDYVPTPTENISESEDLEASSTPAVAAIDDDVLSSYNSVNDILNKAKQSHSDQSINKNSSTHYSLKNRTHKYLPTPIYLCEVGGKIIINITVDASGTVTKTTVNKASTSKNNCIKEQALSYAMESRFSKDPATPSQLGTITFYFKGKN